MRNNEYRQDGEHSLGTTCKCGKHDGIGKITAHQRAERYERQRCTGVGFDDYEAAWLKDYKNVHGIVLPTDHRPYIGQSYTTSDAGKRKSVPFSFNRCCLYGTEEYPSENWNKLRMLADEHQVGECIAGQWVLQPRREIREQRARIISSN